MTAEISAVLGRATLALLVIFGWVSSASAQSASQTEWERVQAAARKEGKIVVAIPLNPELRKALEGVLRSRFGIESEFLVGQSTVFVRRVADEYQAGVRYFDEPFPRFKEGTFVTFGSGPPVVIKNPPHPNATKVFVNWLLSKEGQETWGKAHGQPTRRVDVDTSSLAEIGEQAAKDFLTLAEFSRWENQSEDKILSVRRPAREFASKLLP
ncbi:MAG: hypothetical protein ACREQA_06910 [Candidatus Binatia bacterium]